MTKARGTDGSLLVSLPWTLAALALAIAPHLQYLPIWISAAFLTCAIWRFTIEQRRAALPPTWLRAGLALGCFLGVLMTYSSVSGVGPGSALLAIMAAMKLLETRKRRDQFVLLFISIFLVMSALLREQYIWSLPFLFVAILVIMTAWLRMSAAKQETTMQSFRSSGRLVMYALPLALAMWIFFPRIATPFWQVPIDTSAGTTGLSDTMSPGDISSLSLSDELAFRVKFEDAVPAQKDLYWRGLVLTNFNGRTWTGSGPLPGNNRLEREKISTNGGAVNYSVTLEPTGQHWIFALDIPYTWDLSKKIRMGRQQQLSRDFPIDQRISYEAASFIDYRVDVQMPEMFKKWYVDLPEDSNPQTKALAVEMLEQAGSAEAYIREVLLKFHEQEYYYTLEPPLLGRDPVDRFLFDTRQGFCEHYASAFAVMMRAANIPSRVVLGYQGGEMNPQAEHLIVRQSDAHAWTEVWLPNQGWRRVDPTAAVAPERIDAGMSGSRLNGAAAAWGFSSPSQFFHNLGLSWDAINAKWNDLVLGYGPENQDRFMRFLGMEDPNWRKMILSLLAIVFGMILVISLILAKRYRAPRPDKALRLYQKFVKKSALSPIVGETPDSFADRARAESKLHESTIDDVTAAYIAARYGAPDAQALSKLQQSVSRL